MPAFREVLKLRAHALLNRQCGHADNHYPGQQINWNAPALDAHL
jgi:hypothetical protein